MKLYDNIGYHTIRYDITIQTRYYTCPRSASRPPKGYIRVSWKNKTILSHDTYDMVRYNGIQYNTLRDDTINTAVCYNVTMLPCYTCPRSAWRPLTAAWGTAAASQRCLRTAARPPDTVRHRHNTRAHGQAREQAGVGDKVSFSRSFLSLF